MLYTALLLSLIVLHGSCYLSDNEDLPQNRRYVRQLGLGSLLNPTNNQGSRRGPACEGPRKIKGKCLPIEQCVIKELDQDYVKNKAFLCALRPEGPVGVCCPNSISKPVVYKEGMFGNKNFGSGKTGDSENVSPNPPEDLPEDVQIF